jgi:ABC-2 type transport system permease protein
MVANAELQRIEGHGWGRGFANILRKENRQLWSGHRWLVQTIIWLVILNGLVAMALFVLPSMLAANSSPDADAYIPVREAISVLFQLGTLALGVGAIILTQDMLIAEKQTGVAEWLISKPLSRSAYFLAKFSSSILGVALLLVGFQSIVAYGMISAAQGSFYPLQPYLVGVAGLGLHAFFYLALTLMLGVFASNRSVVLGASFGVLGAGLILPNLIGLNPTLLTPWAFGSLLGPFVNGISLPVPLWLPFAACSVWILLFVSLALWKINRLEF